MRSGRSPDVERLAQPADMHVDGARIDVGVVAPHRIEQLLAAEHPARMFEEMLEQPELGRAEATTCAVAADAVAGDVHFEVGIGELLAGQRRADPAHHRADPRDQLLGAERLGHIIVGAGLEAADAVAPPRRAR